MSATEAKFSDEEEKRALLAKIKDASNGPEHAKRRIEALDKMVANLKLRRKLCGESMKADEEEMKWLDKEIEQINSRYKPVCSRLQERIQTRDNVEKNLQLAEQTMLQIMNQTKGTAFSGLISNSKMQKREASSLLKATRGFSTTPDSTFYQGRRLRK